MVEDEGEGKAKENYKTNGKENKEGCEWGKGSPKRLRLGQSTNEGLGPTSLRLTLHFCSSGRLECFRLEWLQE